MTALTIADVFDRKKDNTQNVRILLDPGLKDELLELERELGDAKTYDDEHTNARKREPAVEKKLDELEKRIADARVTFKFKSIGREPYSMLLDEYKPREGNEFDEELGFNSEEFPPHLIALSAVIPEMELADAYRIWNEWSESETMLIMMAAVTANKEIVDIPFTRSGIRMGTLSTGKASTTQPVEESPTPPS